MMIYFISVHIRDKSRTTLAQASIISNVVIKDTYLDDIQC